MSWHFWLPAMLNKSIFHGIRPSKWQSGAERLKGLALLLAIGPSLALSNDVIYEAPLLPYPAPILIPLTVGQTKLDLVSLHLSRNLTILDSKHRPLLGRTLERETLIGGSGEVEYLDRYEAPATSLGDWPLNLASICTRDLGRLEAFSGFPIEGVLGFGSFVNCRFEFLYGEEKFRIRRGRVAEMPGFNSAPISVATDLPSIEFEVEGVMEHFFLDTTGNQGVAFNGNTFRRLVASGFIEKSATPGGFASETGQVYAETGLVRRLQLFGRKLDGMVVSTVEGNHNMLGTSFLLGFDSVVDLDGKRFWFRPRELQHPQLDPELMLGMRALFYKGSLVAVAVQAGGPADKAGISRLDRVDRIGSVNTGKFNLISLQELCQTHAGAEVEIEFYHHSTDRNIKTKLRLPPAIVAGDSHKGHQRGRESSK